MVVRSKAAIAIQSFMKGMRTRTRFLVMRRAAVRIQALIRGKFSFFSLAFCKLIWFVGHIARKEMRVIQIEKYVVIMQSSARGFMERRKRCLQAKAALRIQSLWRGYLVRRNETKTKRVMRERVKAANSRVEARISFFIFLSILYLFYFEFL